MKFKTVELPLHIYIGEGAISHIQSILSDLDVQNFLLITDQIVYEIIGRDIDENISTPHQTFFVETADMNQVQKILDEVSNGADSVVGIGGGKVLDVSKVVAMKLNIEFISVPTTASHDGLASPVASFKKNGRPVSIPTNPPSAVLADLEVIKSCPIRLIRSGYGDLISNITAVKDWQLARDLTNEPYDEIAASLALMSAELMLNKSHDLDFSRVSDLEMLVRGLIMSGTAIALVGSSRPASGSEHRFSHALDYLGYGNGTHGEQVAIGTIIMEYFFEKYYDNGDWEKVKTSFSRINLPTKARDIGLNEDQVLQALLYAKEIRKSRFTILDAANPKKEDFIEAIKRTGIV
ncbi:glycerol-1-phosphate dehydrogenase [Archaeoglobales archaeon ex4484_92]|nr:MAG: glycerol-1-phosphate dehydrogenase [Archaeoglobales archaeon ex4484_92]